MKHIDNWKNFSFIAKTLSTISANHWNAGANIRPLIRQKRSHLKSAAYSFEQTINMPCGYQDAAGDKLEEIGREYMILVHAYLSCRYGTLTKRLSAMIDDTLPESTIRCQNRASHDP